MWETKMHVDLCTWKITVSLKIILIILESRLHLLLHFNLHFHSFHFFRVKWSTCMKKLTAYSQLDTGAGAHFNNHQEYFLFWVHITPVDTNLRLQASPKDAVQIRPWALGTEWYVYILIWPPRQVNVMSLNSSFLMWNVEMMTDCYLEK